MKKLPLHIKIIIGLILGVVVGILSREYGFQQFIMDWFNPFGKIFMNGLKLIAVPLVLASLIMGIAGMKDFANLSKMGTKTMILYVFTTVLAVTIGLTFVNVVGPGEGFPEDLKVELMSQFSGDAAKKIGSMSAVKDRGPLQALVDIVPSNIFSSISSNRNMLQAVFFALIFGIALMKIDSEKSKPVIGFFDGLNEVIMKLVDFIMILAPIAVFGLLSGLIAGFSGDIYGLLYELGEYCITVLAGLLTMILIVYPLILFILTKGKVNLKNFYKGILPAQLLAFSTSSSAATLPVTKEQCENALGIDEEVTSFVLPLGATINMDGTSLYQAVAAVFIANVAGFDLTLGDQLSILAMSVLASIGSAAVPGAGIVMLAVVLESLGIPLELIALILGVDRILDMCRTTVNVTGDATVSYIIASQLGKIKTK
jgi:Na+/H+-dicarboxylate symporter